MKIDDLMIGFWYRWYAEGNFYTEGENSGKPKFYYYKVDKDTFNLSEDTIANFEPVELTPEILEKNGWHKDSLFDDWYGPVNIYGHNAPFITVDSCEIKYVHELQLLLKLNHKDINIII